MPVNVRGAALVLILGGCKADGIVCPQTVEAVCADFTNSQMISCPGTWTEAQSDRSLCNTGVGIAFNETTYECANYFLLDTVRVDWGYDFLYDKITGELVAIFRVGLSPSPSPPPCIAGRTDFPPPTTWPGSGCTRLADCNSQRDGGSDGN